MSLYDYLGRPAGNQLGSEVYRAAKQFDVHVETREVKTRSYQGKVMLYPKQFLDNYFNKG